MPICLSYPRRALVAASISVGACTPDRVPTAPTTVQHVPGATPALQARVIRFTTTDLGSLGGSETYVDAINNLGQAVGWSSTGTGRSAFIWSASTGMQAIPGLREGTGLNDLGQVVGPMGAHSRRFGLWTAQTGTTVVELTGVTENFGFTNIPPTPHDINNAGQIVGQYHILVIPDNANDAFVASTSGAGRDLSGSLGGGRVDRATDINNLGQIVGGIGFVIDHHPYLWQPSSGSYQATRLPRIGGPLGTTNNVAYSINDAGQVVGVNVASSTTHHAFLWTEGGGMVDLTPQHAGDSEARGINEAGQVVGYRVVSGVGDRAFFWSAATGLVDLPTLEGAQSRAHAINNRGEIVGVVTPAGGVQRATLWKLDVGPANAVEAIADLVALVDGLADDGTLGRGEAEALGAKLAAASKQLEKNSTAAANALRAFVHQVEALVKSGRLTAGQGEELTHAAEVALDFMQA